MVEKNSSGMCQVLGINFTKLSLAETMEQLRLFLGQTQPRHVVTANPEIVMMAQKNPEFARIVQQADLVTPDGTGILWGARCLGDCLPERVTGVDLTAGLLAEAARQGLPVALLGGQPGVAATAAQKMQETYPGLQIPVVHHGYLQGIDPALPAQLMKQAGVAIVLVAMGAPRQEEWIAAYKAATGARVLIGIGGVLDLWAGQQRRAPKLCCQLGMEWAWRLLRQPSRLPRAMAIPTYMWRIKQVQRRNKGRSTQSGS